MRGRPTAYGLALVVRWAVSFPAGSPLRADRPGRREVTAPECGPQWHARTVIRGVGRHRGVPGRGLVACLVAGCVVGLALPGCAAQPAARSSAGSWWRLVWSSDFAGPAGTVPSRWQFQTGGSGWGNREQEYYVSRSQDQTTENAVLDGNGDLAITARRNTDPRLRCSYDAAGVLQPGGAVCQYTSARLNTAAIPAADPLYGRIEARIELPRGAGIWPAFWALGTDIDEVGWPESGEIDIMENFGSAPEVVFAHLHGPTAASPQTPWSVGATLTLPVWDEFSSGFHTFAADWYPDRISFSVDGHVYETIDRASLPSGQTWVFDKPFYLILNVAVGSMGSGSGAPDSLTSFPQTMLVRWVKVYALRATASAEGS